MTRFMVTITKEEGEALIDLAQRERRDPRQQAALLIRRGLERHGVIDPERETVELFKPEVVAKRAA